jgi:hypothetical protein
VAAIAVLILGSWRTLERDEFPTTGAAAALYAIAQWRDRKSRCVIIRS